MKRIISFLSLLVVPFFSQAQFVTMDGLGFVQMLGHKDFSVAYPMMDTSVQKKISKEQLKQLWGQLEGQYGAWKDAKIVSTERTGDKDVATVDNDFEKATVTMKVAMNSNKMVVGFTISGVKQKEQHTTPLPANCKEEGVTVHTPDGDLKGTIVMPEKFAGRVVLIVAGSGPTDRNGNNILGVTAQSYKLLAYALAEKGIASMRYDKRYVGESNSFTKDPSRSTIDEFVKDAVQCLKTLKADKRFTRIYLCGHSEGSLISMLASKTEKVNGYISLCGMGEALDKTLEKQLVTNAGFKKEDVQPVIASVMKNTVLPQLPKGLETIITQSNVVFLHSIFQYDPQKVMKGMKIPVLIVTGTRDIQIPKTDADLLKKAKPDAKMLVIENMNHTLKDAPADMAGNMETYKKPELPLSAGLAAGLADFINKN